MPPSSTANPGEFLQPWTAGSTKDYSNNIDYAVGVHILTEWEADFTNATITLAQDNKPGDAQGGPTVVLERSYNQTTWGWTVSYKGLDPSLNNVFYFAVANGHGTESFTGHYFNISDASTTTTTATSSAPASPSTADTASSSTALPTTTTTTPASSSGSKTPQPASQTATVTAAPVNGGGTPVGTVAGMAIGVVVGSLLVVGGAWWVWKLHCQKKKRRRNRDTVSARFDPGHHQPYVDGGGSGRRKPTYEADGIQRVEIHESGGVPVCELREPETERGVRYELHDGSGSRSVG